MRIQPRAAIGIVVGLIYPAVFVGLMIASGVKYPDIGQSTDTIVRSALLPELALAVVLTILVTWLGWWGPILRDERAAPRWLLVLPVLFGLALVGGLVENFGALLSLDRLFLLAVLAATLAVGFCEELTYRGITVVGLRASRPEWQVWLGSSLMFALLHGWNYLAGQDFATTVFQMMMTFGIGSLFYACRRATGSLVVCMVFHALYDLLSLTTGSGVMGIALLPMLAIFAIAAIPLFLHDHRQAARQTS